MMSSDTSPKLVAYSIWHWQQATHFQIRVDTNAKSVERTIMTLEGSTAGLREGTREDTRKVELKSNSIGSAVKAEGTGFAKS